MKGLLRDSRFRLGGVAILLVGIVIVVAYLLSSGGGQNEKSGTAATDSGVSSTVLPGSAQGAEDATPGTGASVADAEDTGTTVGTSQPGAPPKSSGPPTTLPSPSLGGEGSGPAGSSPTSSPSAPPTVSKGIRGRVVDMDTNEPIGDASVTAGGKRAISRPDGTFILDVRATVGEQVLAEKPGYIAAQRVVREIQPDGWGDVQLELLSVSSPNAPPPMPQ